MRGNNELRLNQATMIYVVQAWLDSEFSKGWARVVSVEPIQAGSYSPEFSIKLTDVPPGEVK